MSLSIRLLHLPQVIEKREQLPGRPPRDDPRAYCLMLGPRGLGPLLAADMDLGALTTPSNGLMSTCLPVWLQQMAPLSSVSRH